MCKIGILGGTFDPPHIGHVIVAKEVQLVCQLDEIWFIPTNEPPHKGQAAASASSRRAMLEQLTVDEPTWCVNAIELERTGKSYTIDTIQTLKRLHPTKEFHFIIGADMVDYLPKWDRIDELTKLITFISVQRPGYSGSSPYDVCEVDIPLIEVSSTMIRERLVHGQSPHYLLPPRVYTYMKEHQLYGYERDEETNQTPIK